MKKFLTQITMLLLVGFSASALTKAPLGSWHLVSGVMTEGTKSTPYTTRVVLDSFFSANGRDLVKLNATFSYVGEQPTTREVILENDLRFSSLIDLEDFINNQCEQNGGVKETVTVIAGAFLACKISQTYPGSPSGEQSSTIWYGAVYGGEIKAHWAFSDGSQYSYELVEFGL